MHTVIFGRSSCSFCVRALQLAERLAETRDGFSYRYVDIQQEGLTKADMEKTIGKPVRTVPQIFVDKTHIGGYTEFAQYVRDNALLEPPSA